MEDEECEEWIVESLRLYKDLHDFELQDPTRVIEWIGEKSICVAGYDGTKTNEILQLLVPQKLQVKENQGLCPERDLKVEHGGFSQYPVYSLKHVPEHSLLLTSGPASGLVQVWQIGAEDKDVIKPTSTIQSDVGKDTWTKIATTAAATPQVLHGSHINNVQITEIESNKQIYTLATSGSEGLGSLSFLDENTFLMCGLSGRLILVDVRQIGIASEGSLALSAPCSSHWIATVKPGHRGIASLSSEGHITITDSRDLGVPLKCARGRISEPSMPETFTCLNWAPRLDNCVSISGFDGTVQIYDTQSWDNDVKERDALFTHRGHSVMGVCEDGRVPRVTCHTWHPWKERTLISAANDGSLHMWDWLDNCTGL
ncbi:WD repeat-containing protein 73 [Aquarana catesbeiana]|uniref:WD repeat-containing protein 73 n=1 Tax=Aquarana catesbeiana TaxID=8400 RepID=UPI003CC9A4BB